MQPSNNHAFIDSQNLNLGIRDCGWQLDFGRFRRYLADKYRVSKAFLFIGYVAGNEALYTYLQSVGYLVIFKPTLEHKKSDGTLHTKGNVDAELVLHAMIQYPNYDKAVIVSGDGDFHCLVEYLAKQGKLLRVIVPNRKKYSALLRRFIPYIVYLNDLERKLGKEKQKDGD
ncbi:hypothetical protein A3I42_00985 [Candidatus Uhrbacteria bacterium RIFCSPLOWO2_02_FULL_49_11]|uniref:NYN domain-containing protein n=1 Tax=Candidatus Uhrbacteria bacterium RIFCSPLOWO2_02_FULL_49_11 TaxID=1802409 RepID=A0A1F7VCL2_9BACT|nr:MAG: hypothetical protein A3I42_00985 [Candidatus Uhrbacteria bacterium RIFCSPLOWO2_02_FULL_49_11]